LTNPTEAQTRRDLIDPALKQAGWDLDNRDQVGFEIPVDDTSPAAWHALEAKLRALAEPGVSYDVPLPAGITDYALYRPDGDIIAVVEAKRTSIQPRLAQAQTEFYVREIAKQQAFLPFAFMTNGHTIQFWDVDRANPRQVAGFFSPDDLANLLYLRQNALPLTGIPINQDIVDRPYQFEAMQRLCKAFEVDKKRKALLVMATGTGKTRAAMALTDLFMRANQARRILFVADRDALVRQALNEGFEEHLPDEPCSRIYSHNVERVKTNRLFAVTLQTLSNCFQDFTPGFFDLIIFDEVHRSIFNKWNEVLQYFDGRMIGLTATPAQYIDRNTFLEFDCTDEVPTYYYSRQEAIDEGYLVDYELYIAQTRFQRKGIRGVDLSEEEKQALQDQGLDPDGIDFSGTQLERDVTNKDTLRKQWEEIWDVCLKDESGQLPGKTIVFAMTQAHALRLLQVFEEMFPQYHDLARVITYQSEHKGTAVKTFKRQSLPRIAISVDMLETGVNVPEAVNLVFMRPVQSPIKLEQMIGRGTRNHDTCTHHDWLPNGRKEKFLIIDFWQNDFDKPPPDAEETPATPVLIKLFNTRLDLMAHYLDDQQKPEAQQLTTDLRAQIAGIPLDTYSVQTIYHEVERAWKDSFWFYLTQDKLDFLRHHVAPLLRFAPMGDVQAVSFTTKIERLKLQRATGQDPTPTANAIAHDVSRLPDFVYEDPHRAQAAQLCQRPRDLASASVEDLTRIIEQLAGQMKNRTKPKTLELDLADVIEMRSYIILDQQGEPVYAQEYRERVQHKVLGLLHHNPILGAIARGEPVSDVELLELERLLQEELAGSDLKVNPANIRRAYALKVGCLLEFLRQLLELPEIPDYADIVRRQFQQFIASHPFNDNQILFLRTLSNVLAQKHRITWADLYDQPFTQYGASAIDRLFTEDQADELINFANTLAIGG